MSVEAEAKAICEHSSKTRATEINGLYKKFESALKKGAHYAFDIGKILNVIVSGLDVSESWTQWCDNYLDFSVTTANRFLRVYECYKDNPELLDGQTVTGALKCLSAPQKDNNAVTKYGDADKRPETSWEDYFNIPPLGTKIKLTNHRFEQPNSHELYLIRRGLNYPVKMVEVLAPGSDDSRLKTAHQGMMEGIQVTLETYFQEVERIEELQKKEKQ